jgi:hypothetical protein
VTRSKKELIAAKQAVAVAKLVEWRRQCARLARLAVAGIVDWVEAADVLYDIAVGNRLVALYGDDFITGMLAIAIKWAWALDGRA